MLWALADAEPVRDGMSVRFSGVAAQHTGLAGESPGLQMTIPLALGEAN